MHKLPDRVYEVGIVKEPKLKKIVQYVLIGAAVLTIITLNSCVPKNLDGDAHYKTKLRIVNVELDNWNTLPGDLLLEIRGEVDEGKEVYLNLDVNGRSYYEGNVDVQDNSFVFSKVIDSNLYYSNIEPLNVDVRLSLNRDFSTATEYSTAITLPIAIMGRKAPEQVRKIEELFDFYEEGSFEDFPYQRMKCKGLGIIDTHEGDLYAVFNFRKGRYEHRPYGYSYWYYSSVQIYSYKDKQTDSLVISLGFGTDRTILESLDGSPVVYQVGEYNPYKGLSLEEFIDTYLSEVATPIDSSSVEMLLSAEAFNKLVEEDEDFMPLSYRRVYEANDDFRYDKPVFCGLYILDNFILMDRDTPSKEPVRTLKGILVFPKNMSPPVNFLVSSKTENLIQIGPFSLIGVGEYSQAPGPFLNSPYLRAVLNLPGGPSGYNYDVDMITQIFDKMDTVFSETRILTPQEFKEIFSFSYNRGLSRLDDAIEVINELDLP